MAGIRDSFDSLPDRRIRSECKMVNGCDQETRDRSVDHVRNGWPPHPYSKCNGWKQYDSRKFVAKTSP